MTYSWMFSVLLITTKFSGTTLQLAPCSKMPHIDKMVYYEMGLTGLVPKRCPFNMVFHTESCDCDLERNVNSQAQSQIKTQAVVGRFPSVRTISRSRQIDRKTTQTSGAIEPVMGYSVDNNNYNKKKQQYMIDILRVSWRLLQSTTEMRVSTAMKKPCSCKVNCCKAPNEPRRILQFVDVPMAQHPGCCGCIQCPVKTLPALPSRKARRRLRISRHRNARFGSRTRKLSFA